MFQTTNQYINIVQLSYHIQRNVELSGTLRATIAVVGKRWVN